MAIILLVIRPYMLMHLTILIAKKSISQTPVESSKTKKGWQRVPGTLIWSDTPLTEGGLGWQPPPPPLV